MASQSSTPNNQSAAEWKRLLLDWANSPDPIEVKGAIEWLWKRHRKALQPVHGKHGEHIAADVRMLLRKAWVSPDPRRRDWFLNLARYRYAQGCMAGMGLFRNVPLEVVTGGQLPAPPEGNNAFFDSAVFYTQTKLAHKMRKCKAADCDRPFFFSRRKGQEYCSTDCRDLVRDAASLKWWREHGNAWRAARRRKKTRDY